MQRRFDGSTDGSLHKFIPLDQSSGILFIKMYIPYVLTGLQCRLLSSRISDRDFDLLEGMIIFPMSVGNLRV